MTSKYYPLKLGAILLTVSTLFLAGCEEQRPRFQKEPIDDIIRDMSHIRNFSIILYDMDYDEPKDAYKHQYQIIADDISNPDSVTQNITDWKTVSSIYFQDHQNDMGMELVNKKDGVVTKATAPAGYSNYIGNEKYGQWRTHSDGHSFWEFYGKYAFMSHMFNMMTYPVRRSYWNDYYYNYAPHSPYYGPSSSGGRMYGTNSAYNKSRTSSTWNKRPSDFKSKVRSKVQRSASRSRARIRRSNSRGGYNSRSRGGGFGK